MSPHVVALPIDRVIVERVDSAQTSDPAVISYTITARTTDAEPRRVQYQTVNDLYASACRRSAELQRPLVIRWKPSRFGRDISRVEMERHG